MFAALVPLAATSSSGGSSVGLLVTLVLMAAVFYFLLIRPQQRRARQQRSLVQSLDVGDEVTTIGGMYGTIRDVEEDSVLVEVAPGVEIRFVKSAIARKLVFDEQEEEGETGPWFEDQDEGQGEGEHGPDTPGHEEETGQEAGGRS